MTDFINWCFDCLTAFFNFSFAMEILPSISFGMIIVSVMVVGFVLKAFLR